MALLSTCRASTSAIRSNGLRLSRFSEDTNCHFWTDLKRYLYHDNLTVRGDGFGPGAIDAEVFLRFRRFVDVVDAISVLIAGALAGLLAVFLFRQKREA